MKEVKIFLGILLPAVVAFLKAWFMLVGFVFVGTAMFLSTDSTDKNRWLRSGLSYHFDNETGVEYIGKGEKCLTPRVDANGKPMLRR